MHPFLSGKTALAPRLPQVQNTLVSGRAIRFPLPFYGFLENMLADTPASVAVAHTSAEHRAGPPVLPVGSVYPANIVVLPLKTAQRQCLSLWAKDGSTLASPFLRTDKIW